MIKKLFYYSKKLDSSEIYSSETELSIYCTSVKKGEIYFSKKKKCSWLSAYHIQARGLILQPGKEVRGNSSSVTLPVVGKIEHYMKQYRKIQNYYNII